MQSSLRDISQKALRFVRPVLLFTGSALALTALLLVLTGALPLDSPEPIGALSDNLWSAVDSIYTRIVGPRSFDPPANVRVEPSPVAPDTPAALPSAIPTLPAPAAAPSLTPAPKTEVVRASPEIAMIAQPVYSGLDFLAGYLDNATYPILLDGKPWDNGSINVYQYQEQGGGTSYWDYWIEDEPWDSPKHMWRDDQGNWHTYAKEKVTDSSGKAVTAYVLVDRRGPGVMDKLWFTHDAVGALMGLFTQPDPPQVKDWGNLYKIGNLRIEVDGKRVYDGQIERWFSGDAQQLPDDVKEAFVWRYGVLGANGNILPIPYEQRLKISVYGGTGKPKWFMATGLTFPPTTRVRAYTGELEDLQISTLQAYVRNVYFPETYIDRLDDIQNYSFNITSDQPAVISLHGSGTAAALQFRIPKGNDPSQLSFQVHNGDEVGITVPFLAFFSDPDVLSFHHSTPIGAIDAGDSILFYTNLPMPFENGMELELSSESSTPIPLTARIATNQHRYGTRLRVIYAPKTKLAAYGPNFQVDISGSGKMVGLVLSTKDQLYDKVPRAAGGQEDRARRVWPMGYLEGNLTISDGAGNARHYSGQEDWAEGGYYFNDGYTTPPGGSNRPFAGVMRYRQGGNNGYATLFRYFNDTSAFPFNNGLHLSFGHGTWQNNYPVTYSAVIFYYVRVPGTRMLALPASDYVSVPVPQPEISKP